MLAPHHSVFLQAGCPSCCTVNSVKALKAVTASLMPHEKCAPLTSQMTTHQVPLTADFKNLLNIGKTQTEAVKLSGQCQCGKFSR